MRIYLDNCCFNRPFDNQLQLRIRLETEAKLEIQKSIAEHRHELIWSYILDLENNANPFDQRKKAIQRWKHIALAHVVETDDILKQASQFQKKGINPKDALHLACAVSSQCHYFLSTDDYLIKKAISIANIKVMDPIAFITEEERNRDY